MFTYGITCVYLEQIHLGALCIFMIYVDCAPFPWCYLINFFAYQLEKKKKRSKLLVAYYSILVGNLMQLYLIFLCFNTWHHLV